MSEEEVMYPSLYERIIESRINKFVTKWFRKTMTFFFGSSSVTCSLSPVDLMKSAVVYLMSSGVLYSVIDEYATRRYTRHGTFREALTASLVVLFADISHRYAGHVRPKPANEKKDTEKKDNDSGYTGFPGGV